jgi:predicted nucleotidyltransferase
MSFNPESVLPVLSEVLEGEPSVVAGYHFGSTQDGTAFATSDVDVGVLCDCRLSLDELIRLQDRLNDAIPQVVDLVDVRRVGPFVALDVIRGDRFFCRDEDDADEFDLFVLRRAGDLAYFERQRRDALLSTPIAGAGN